jgi:hypothetical protein
VGASHAAESPSTHGGPLAAISNDFRGAAGGLGFPKLLDPERV